MENSNKKSRLTIALLIALIVFLSAFIIYDKILLNKDYSNSSEVNTNDNVTNNQTEEKNVENDSNKSEVENTETNNQDEPKSNDKENTETTNNDSLEQDYTNLINQLKDTFKVVYKVRNDTHVYCGNEFAKSDKLDGTGSNYYVSKSYDTFDNMINGLKKYATEEVLGLRKEFYVEEDGKLYCEGNEKHDVFKLKDFNIQINKITDKKVFTTIFAEVGNDVDKTNITYDVEFTKTGVATYYYISKLSS